MKIIITGGAGFMGSNMIRYLLREYKDVEVVNFDDLTYAGNLSNLHDLANDPRYTFVKGNISRREDVEALLLKGADLLINYAAETHVDRSILDPDVFIQTNVMGVHNLLEAVRKFKIPRYVQISTDEVYGAVMEGESDEKASFEPRSPYAASKAAGGLLCHAAAVTFGTPVIVTHSVNFFGRTNFPKSLFRFLRVIFSTEKKFPFTEMVCRCVNGFLRKITVARLILLPKKETSAKHTISEPVIACRTLRSFVIF